MKPHHTVNTIFFLHNVPSIYKLQKGFGATAVVAIQIQILNLDMSH